MHTVYSTSVPICVKRNSLLPTECAHDLLIDNMLAMCKCTNFIQRRCSVGNDSLEFSLHGSEVSLLLSLWGNKGFEGSDGGSSLTLYSPDQVNPRDIHIHVSMVHTTIKKSRLPNQATVKAPVHNLRLQYLSLSDCLCSL